MKCPLCPCEAPPPPPRPPPSPTWLELSMAGTFSLSEPTIDPPFPHQTRKKPHFGFKLSQKKSAKECQKNTRNDVLLQTNLPPAKTASGRCFNWAWAYLLSLYGTPATHPSLSTSSSPRKQVCSLPQYAERTVCRADVMKKGCRVPKQM